MTGREFADRLKAEFPWYGGTMLDDEEFISVMHSGLSTLTDDRAEEYYRRVVPMLDEFSTRFAVERELNSNNK